MITAYDVNVHRGLLGGLVLALFLCTACQSNQSDTPDADTADESPPQTESMSVDRDTLTLTGTLLDFTCHAQSEKASADREDPLDCEGDYVAKGYPVGLRTEDDGEVWVLTTVPQALTDYLTSTARVTGVVRSEGVFIPHEIDIRKGTGWVTVM